jgi:hypothetical protein
MRGSGYVIILINKPVDTSRSSEQKSWKKFEELFKNVILLT